MVLLPVLLDAPQGQLIFTRLTAAATLLPAADDRTMDQKRADLLVDAVLSGLPHDALPELQGRRPSIQIVVSADTLLGLDDEPADLAGYGPITAETARRYAADESGTWRRLLTDPDTGALLDIGRDSYRPAQRLRDFVQARDGVCCFPTCGQPGYRCEFEHIVAFSEGGQTCRCGGALACRRHNLCKAGTGWQYRRLPDGSFRWTDDTGHEYTGHPPQRWASARGSPTAGPAHQVGRRGLSPRHAGAAREASPDGPYDLGRATTARCPPRQPPGLLSRRVAAPPGSRRRPGAGADPGRSPHRAAMAGAESPPLAIWATASWNSPRVATCNYVGWATATRRRWPLGCRTPACCPHWPTSGCATCWPHR